MKVSALLHATILVADLPKSRAFYEQVLAFKYCPERPDMGFDGVWYDVGPQQQLHLMRLPNPEAGLQRPQHGGRDRHLAFAVDELAVLMQKLDDAGIAYTISKSGRRALFCRDPDDNALEFIET